VSIMTITLSHRKKMEKERRWDGLIKRNTIGKTL